MSTLKTMFVAGLVIICSAVDAYAEPSPTVSKLMNTPVSAFTFGMYQIRETMREYRETLQEADPGVTVSGAIYQWEENVVQLTVASSSDYDDKTFEEKCQKIFETVRFSSGVVNGEKIVGRLVYGSFFFPFDYESKGDREDQKKLDNMFVISYSAKDKKCTGKLMGTGYSVAKNN